jgi:hypothetical protein
MGGCSNDELRHRQLTGDVGGPGDRADRPEGSLPGG